jgi:hypothetical protein
VHNFVEAGPAEIQTKKKSTVDPMHNAQVKQKVKKWKRHKRFGQSNIN